MKKIFVSILVALCTMGIVAAQDVQAVNDILEQANAAIQTDKAEAINLFEKALVMAEQFGDEGIETVAQCKAVIPKLYMILGKESIKAKDYTKAIEHLEKAVEVGNKYEDIETAEEAQTLIPQILVANGGSLFNAKDFDGSLAAYQKALEMDSTNAKALLGKGNVLAQLGKVDEAVQVYELASQNGEESEAAKRISNLYKKQADACWKAKDMKGTLENARKSTEYVDNPAAERLIGLSAYSLKQYKKAAEAFEAYLSMSPDAKDKNDITLRIAMSLVSAGDNAKACGYFKQLVNDPKNGEYAKSQIAALKCN